MHYAVTAVIAILCFGLGYLTAHWSSDQTPQTKVPDQILAELQHPSSAQLETGQGVPSWQTQLKTQTPEITALINTASSEQISHYLDQVFPDYDLSEIQDKRMFANRLMSEFIEAKNTDPATPLVASATVSFYESITASAVLPRDIPLHQPLFAHLDTQGKVDSGKQIFIRWSNRDSGEVLFFMPQRITADSQQNWVSFSPAKGWKPGTYDVRYYQLNSEMVPIAQTSYVIERVLN